MNTLIDVAAYGIGGMAAAIGFHLATTAYGERVGSALGCVDLECVPTHDRCLMTLLVRLEKLTDGIDTVALVRAADTADQLVFLRTQLETKAISPVPGDQDRAMRMLRRCEKSLQRLLEAVEEDMSARTAVGVQDCMREIVECLEAHMATICVLVIDGSSDDSE